MAVGGIFVLGLAEKRPSTAVALAIIFAGVLPSRALLRKRSDARATATADLQHQHDWERLCTRFGDDAARQIWNRELWLGATADMVFEMLGHPIDVDEHVMKTKTNRTFKYSPTGANLYALRVFVEDGVVVGWEDKR